MQSNSCRYCTTSTNLLSVTDLELYVVRPIMQRKTTQVQIDDGVSGTVKLGYYVPSREMKKGTF